ncbi:hypothetical protein BD414DRAFT_540746 [Trametes punicea]|nr:hypothetical protein BD414DRAFT_540746 [Trametes punicea]
MCKTIGAVALGTVIGVMLYGLIIHQTYRYVKVYPADRPLMKVFVRLSPTLSPCDVELPELPPTLTPSVVVILTLEMVHTALWLVAGYHYLIEQPFTTVVSLQGHWFKVTSTVSDFQRLNWLVAAAYGVAGVTDVTLAATLVFVLHRSRMGSKRCVWLDAGS